MAYSDPRQRWSSLVQLALVIQAIILIVLPTPAFAADAFTRSTRLLGFNDHPLDGRAPAPAGVMLDRLLELGGSFVRIDVHWAWLEWAGPGRANWNPDQERLLNIYLDAARVRGIDVELTVLGTPCWAAAGPPRGCTEQERESLQNAAVRNPNDYARFVGELVRFAAGRARYIGVGNEPNHPWFAASPDPAAYTRLLQATYSTVKKIDPSVAVVAGALAPGNPAGARLDTLAYLQGMYAAGARGAFDYLEYHPYTDGRSPTWFDQQWPLLSYERSVPAVRAVMVANGDDRPMILGEAGWSTVDPRTCSDCGAVPLGVSPSDQAAYLAQALEMAGSWSYVDRFVVYELADHGAPNATTSLDHYGVLGRDLKAKPSANALRQAREQLVSRARTPGPPVEPAASRPAAPAEPAAAPPVAVRQPEAAPPLSQTPSAADEPAPDEDLLLEETV